MCGIYSIISSDESERVNPDALSPRGPDGHREIRNHIVTLGFHRLRINDLTEAGDQPMTDGFVPNAFAVCNGEIYNHLALKTQYNLTTYSNSDCAVLIPLYHRFMSRMGATGVTEPMINMCQSLDAEFAFVIHDKPRGLVIAARDTYGVRPLFWGQLASGGFVFASEVKAIHPIAKTIQPFLPGSVMIIDTQKLEVVSYSDYRHMIVSHMTSSYSEQEALSDIRRNLIAAVAKRVVVSEQPVCALLSGGLDSSLVAAIAATYTPNPIHTYSIGMSGSTDLAYAQVVAEHIGSVHSTITLTPQEFLAAIPETIRVIESYDTTSVRASVGNMLVAAYIAKNSNNKVVLNGDYSDEVCGGYKYMAFAPNAVEFARECMRLVDDIYLFDSLRSDRTICSQGLEARTPFSDPAFIMHYLGLPPSARWYSAAAAQEKMKMEKWLLRKAFDGTGLLPDSVLWRRKEAFSDGVSSPENSWHSIIKAHVESRVSDEDFAARAERFPFNTPQLKESYYYREIFESFYPGRESLIPYYWLPRFCGDIADPSAREIVAP